MSPDCESYENTPVSSDITELVRDLRSVTGNTADLNVMNVRICGRDCAVVSIEGMASSDSMGELVFRPLMELERQGEKSSEEIFSFLTEGSLLAAERKTVFTYGEAVGQLFSGFALVAVDGLGKAVTYGIQGYEKRGVSTPECEQTVHGAQDSFTETVRTNISLIRRRMKTPTLRAEMSQMGEKSHTDVCMLYLTDKVSPETVEKLRRRLSEIKLDTVLSTEYIQPYIDESYDKTLFSAVNTTERPDMACLRLNEGRVCILVDGTPFCLIVPTLFADSFQTMDDYCQKPFYTVLQRILKYISFFLGVAFPGLYVALVTFHPEFFTLKLLLNLAVSEEATPYPLVVEIILLTVMFEIMREAGLRLPKPVGGTVSIVGGLIIGDAAVKSGIVSAPLLIVVGITATASFVIPNLYSALSVLRLIFILAGGLGGLFGISVCTFLLIANICATNEVGVAYGRPMVPYESDGVGKLLFNA
jgi:spore germination protein KA